MSNKNMRTKFGISEVVGQVDPEDLKAYLVSNCQAAIIVLDGSSKLLSTTCTARYAKSPFAGPFDISGGKSLRPLVVRADFETLPSTATDRTAQLAENGLFGRDFHSMEFS